MEPKEFSKQLIKEFSIEEREGTLYISGANYLPEEMDYNDDACIEIVATKAVETANGFYSLIKSNCNTSDLDLSSNARLEMYLALTGFACEIYMKGIIYFEKRNGGKKCTGHKLNELFECLPDAQKDSIKEKLDNVEVVLPSIGNVFETLRYDYELSHIQGDYLMLFDLMEELKTISDGYAKTSVGEMRYANGVLAFE